MSRKLRPSAALALVALISLISAGCGSNAPSETGTAGSSGTASSSSTASSSGAAGSTGTGNIRDAADQDKAVSSSSACATTA
jgi:hypothetical protein